MARRWVKFWVAESLRGTIRFDFTPAERGVWYDLLILAGDCRQDGLIGPGSGVSYPLKWIAGTLNISSLLLRKTLKICKSSERIEINQNGIRILNWHKYQSEYERQKPFRYKKVTPKVTSMVTQKLPVEVEEDIEVEEKKYIKKKPLIPDFIDKELWGSFLEMRKKKHALPTDKAVELLVKELEMLRTDGNDPNEVLKQSIMRSYTGVFPLKTVGNKNQRVPPTEEQLQKEYSR